MHQKELTSGSLQSQTGEQVILIRLFRGRAEHAARFVDDKDALRLIGDHKRGRQVRLWRSLHHFSHDDSDVLPLPDQATRDFDSLLFDVHASGAERFAGKGARESRDLPGDRLV